MDKNSSKQEYNNISPIFKKELPEDSLQNFMDNWAAEYINKVKSLGIFNFQNSNKVQWSYNKISFFVKAFYHVRGHFNKFLLILGKNAPDITFKEEILSKIAGIFGGQELSHEQYYEIFAKAFNITIKNEIIDQENYKLFIKEYNQLNLKWLYEHDWNNKIIAFSAYERLDIIDNDNLVELFKSQDISNESLKFFSAHNGANFFVKSIDHLLLIWHKNPEIVKDAYFFMRSNRINMWDAFSNEFLNYV